MEIDSRVLRVLWLAVALDMVSRQRWGPAAEAGFNSIRRKVPHTWKTGRRLYEVEEL